ncbi:MAG TPA: hypothetical protein PLO34_09215, partial [Pseudoxanthomonas sp.]|nr:hypothetical protein [Pseudoxanthomonas sp.]
MAGQWDKGSAIIANRGDPRPRFTAAVPESLQLPVRMPMASRAVPAFPGFLQRLPDRRWVVVGAAFLLGWLLFAVVWLADRRTAPAEAVPVKAAAEPEAFEPLPRPMPAGDRAT